MSIKEWQIVKEIIIGIVSLTLLVLVLHQKSRVMNPMEMGHTHNHTHSSSQQNNQQTSVTSISSAQAFKEKAINQNGSETINSLTGNKHFDQMSDDVKKSLKASLILEAPSNEVIRPDGLTEVKANGRFTQMPVAVQMPDGTIQIREYSEIPK